ncbi:hypothetical protein ACFFRR_002018 [Megaselia abdita]
MFYEFLLLISVIVGLLSYWIKDTYTYFEKRGIASDKPTPLLGSLKDAILNRANLVDIVDRLYKQFDTSIAGIYDTKTPTYFIRSPELIGQIGIKKFDHFINHRVFGNESNHDLFSDSLLSLQDQKWKDMRSTLSPAYTGSKLRSMFDFIKEVAQGGNDYLHKEIAGKSGMEIEMKDFFKRMTTDIIASTAFGIKTDSLNEKNNQFWEMGKMVTTFDFLASLKIFFVTNFKSLSKYSNIEIFSSKAESYYRDLVLGAMKNRFNQKIFRPDMINMLMEATGKGINDKVGQKSLHNWTDNEVVAQCFIFLVGGFESIATAVSCTAQELMENQDCQEKLKAEIDEVLESLDGKPLTYEAINNMPYLECVISEALRKWPVNSSTDRVCKKSIELDDPNTGKTIKFEEGDRIMIPIAGIQRDPEYFPEPMKFDPERFNKENKSNIKPNTYIPFGVGPRNCIGNRFAMLEVKTILFNLVGSFKLTPGKKSTIPMELDTKAPFFTNAKNGFWINVVDRKKI